MEKLNLQRNSPKTSPEVRVTSYLPTDAKEIFAKKMVLCTEVSGFPDADNVAERAAQETQSDITTMSLHRRMPSFDPTMAVGSQGLADE
jgi:hypothetical protein